MFRGRAVSDAQIVEQEPARRVQWEEDTVDNEGLGRKSSKICCVFHPKREFGESEDESDEGDWNCGHDHHHSPMEK